MEAHDGDKRGPSETLLGFGMYPSIGDHVYPTIGEPGDRIFY